MSSLLKCAGLLVVFGGFAASGSGEERLYSISAPVVYKDLLLVVTSEHGVAAIEFTELIDIQNEEEVLQGIGYRFRFLHKDHAKELSGVGRVYEFRDPDTGDYQEEKSEQYIEDGANRLKWSIGGDKRGWIYYKPEEIRVQIAHADRFQARVDAVGGRRPKLDLSRFLWK